MLLPLLLLFAHLLFVAFTGLKNLGGKNSVIDLYIAESKGFSSGKTFSIQYLSSISVEFYIYARPNVTFCSSQQIPSE